MGLTSLNHLALLCSKLGTIKLKILTSFQMFNIIYVIKKDDLLFVFSKEKPEILFVHFYNKIFANLKFGCVVFQQVYKTINDSLQLVMFLTDLKSLSLITLQKCCNRQNGLWSTVVK